MTPNLFFGLVALLLIAIFAIMRPLWRMRRRNIEKGLVMASVIRDGEAFREEYPFTNLAAGGDRIDRFLAGAKRWDEMKREGLV